jgi:cyanate permease
LQKEVFGVQFSIGNYQARTGTLSPAVLVRIGALLLAALSIAANFTNYGPLIPLLQSALHISSGQAGLFSTLLYAGIACTYLPGGMLADRYGSRRVLIGSLLLIGLGGCLLPLVENLAWMLLWRALIGLGSGAAIVAGSQAAARLGKYAALGQGLYGGAMQAGAGLGLFLTPQLLVHVGWQGSFVCWGVFALFACLIWLNAIPKDTGTRAPVPPRHFTAGWRTPTLWCLGLVHLGTLGIGQAIAPWLALYFATRCAMPVPLAALLGSIGLFAGMIFRPLGGVVLSHKVFGSLSLLRLGTMLACLGVGLLALPTSVAPLVGVGIALLSFGTTFPYAAVFSEAGRVGQQSGMGTGTAQGMVSLLSAPASSLGPPLIGLLLARPGGFSSAFGALALLGLLPISAALLAGPLLKQRAMGAGKDERTQRQAVRAVEGRTVANRSRGLERQLQAAIAQLQRRQKVELSAPLQPLVACLDCCSLWQKNIHSTLSLDTPTIEHLMEAGAMLLLLSIPFPGLQGESGEALTDKQRFQRLFDQAIWPLFAQLVFYQVSGLCLIGSPMQEGDEGSPLHAAVSLQQRKTIEHALGLLARLVQLPVLTSGLDLSFLPSQEGQGEKGATQFLPFRAQTDWQGKGSLQKKGEVSEAAITAFLATCSDYGPPSLKSLHTLKADIGEWLYQREYERLHQSRHMQPVTVQKAKGCKRETHGAANGLLNTRLQARQHKLNAIRGTSLRQKKRTVAAVSMG